METTPTPTVDALFFRLHLNMEYERRLKYYDEIFGAARRGTHGLYNNFSSSSEPEIRREVVSCDSISMIKGFQSESTNVVQLVHQLDP